jgi:hypothetical protein
MRRNTTGDLVFVSRHGHRHTSDPPGGQARSHLPRSQLPLPLLRWSPASPPAAPQRGFPPIWIRQTARRACAAQCRPPLFSAASCLAEGQRRGPRGGARVRRAGCTRSRRVWRGSCCDGAGTGTHPLVLCVLTAPTVSRTCVSPAAGTQHSLSIYTHAHTHTHYMRPHYCSILTFQLLVERASLACDTPRATYDSILTTDPQIPGHLPHGAQQLLAATLAKDPRERPSVQDLQHPWVTQFCSTAPERSAAQSTRKPAGAGSARMLHKSFSYDQQSFRNRYAHGDAQPAGLVGEMSALVRRPPPGQHVGSQLRCCARGRCRAASAEVAHRTWGTPCSFFLGR